MEMPIVLFVDDEPNILKTLRRLFMDEDYDVHTAGNGREALELIAGGLQPTLIISDQRMPEMGGAEFLAQAAVLVPDSIRMVLTGYADINAAVMAINRGGIYRYIMKPWNDDDLKLTVREALAHFKLVAENRALSQELAEKNRHLAQMNEQLEVMVKARTSELDQKVRELEGRDQIQQYLLRVHSLGELLEMVLTVVAKVCGLDGAAYYATEAEGAIERQAFFAAPEGQQLDGTEREAVESEIQACLPRLSSAGLEGSAGGSQVFAHAHGLYALAPVATSSQFLGVLLARRPPNQPFTETELDTLLGFAMQTAIGIKDCHVHDHYDDIQSSLADVLNEFSGP